MNIEQSCKHEDEKLFKQRLQRVHQSVGISFSLLMYVAIFFGIFAILLPFIQNWEKPSRHYKMPNITQIDYNSLIEPILADPNYPKINPITITLPGNMLDPSLKISTDFVETIIMNPNTKERFIDNKEVSNLASFLNQMHYGRPFKDFGVIVFGIMAVGVMFLVIGGVYLILKIKYKNSDKSPTSKFSKWHRKIFIWTFAPFIIITLTGAMFNLGFKGDAVMSYIASKGEATSHTVLAAPYLFPKVQRIDLKNDSVKMLPVSELISKAKEIMPKVDWQRIRIVNYGDSSAIFKLEGYNPYMPFLNGILNKPSVTLSGVDGKLVDKQDVLDRHWSAIFTDIMLFMHFLFGVDTFTRFFIATLMLFSTFALGFGVLLYLEKKSRKFGDNIPIYQGFGKLSLAVMIGVIPATGLLFVLQWLLPFDMENRVLIQKGLFAVAWVATLTWSFYRLNSYKAAKEFLYLGGILFILSPIIHFINSGFSPIRLWNEEVYTVLSVDIGLFIFGLILLVVAYKLPVNREKIQEFWTSRGVK
ncbi:PepSY-associated TM helix domain-containing protein [Aliarcobacter lanthieri]|uniref:PepSY-associated TM helix domain-containing protein n=3 Tax=Aliarcobacter lanthieri TaxID=1355374 RepID=UPI0004A6D529|nr:PepSY-associated TM helix domain-containing protein [Aliarcobacter lanthieri]QKF60001.1 PepSY domain-containing membrane protein [Aliarcobacter lanthieri]